MPSPGFATRSVSWCGPCWGVTYTLNESVCELHYSKWIMSFLIGLAYVECLPLVESWSSIAFKISQQWYQLTTADASYPVSFFQLNGAGASLSFWTALRTGQNLLFCSGNVDWIQHCISANEVQAKQSKLKELGPLSLLIQCKMLLQTELCIKQSILFLQLHAC